METFINDLKNSIASLAPKIIVAAFNIFNPKVIPDVEI